MKTTINFTADFINQLKDISENSDAFFQDCEKSIDILFYEMVNKSLHHQENLPVTSQDVFHIMQVKEILQILSQTFNSNHNA